MTVQTWLEHFGVAVSAISGVLAARGKRVDLFGVLVLALVTAFGGGTVRDVLVGDLPVVWIRQPAFLLNATAIALITFFARRIRELPRSVLLVADAFALALFTIVGTRTGVALDFAPPVAVLLGVITGVAGGIVRDVLTGEVPLVFQPQIYLYATAALTGATAFVTLLHWWPNQAALTVICTVLILGMRLAGIRLKLSLPVLDSEEMKR
ncbi:MAG TPA: trimeric intracellular cation channel family protein [Candidatus Limnocylindria bacterium]|nr:trimeric intracellular cation channel family protein [Candidatus Limnocylindria bacterium]